MLDKFVARKDARGSKTSERAHLCDPCKGHQDLCEIQLQDNGTEKDLVQEQGAETTAVSEPTARERIQEQEVHRRIRRQASIQVTRNCCTGGCFSKNPSDKVCRTGGFFEDKRIQEQEVHRRIRKQLNPSNKIVAKADLTKITKSKDLK
jgi:hypothetical protein